MAGRRQFAPKRTIPRKIMLCPAGKTASKKRVLDSCRTGLVSGTLINAGGVCRGCEISALAGDSTGYREIMLQEIAAGTLFDR